MSVQDLMQLFNSCTTPPLPQPPGGSISLDTWTYVKYEKQGRFLRRDRAEICDLDIHWMQDAGLLWPPNSLRCVAFRLSLLDVIFSFSVYLCFRCSRALSPRLSFFRLTSACVPLGLWITLPRAACNIRLSRSASPHATLRHGVISSQQIRFCFHFVIIPFSSVSFTVIFFMSVRLWPRFSWHCRWTIYISSAHRANGYSRHNQEGHLWL